jgi:hypothetical protein
MCPISVGSVSTQEQHKAVHLGHASPLREASELAQPVAMWDRCAAAASEAPCQMDPELGQPIVINGHAARATYHPAGHHRSL